MLTKMRRRFIASAMAAMGAVTLVLLVAINLWNYNITTNRLDDTINSLITTGKNPYSGSSNFTLPDIFSDNSPESKYMTRYFAVVYDSDGDAVRVFSDYIATVSAQEALYYASDALSSGHTQGYYGDYRYCLKSGSSGAAVIFLNASPERQSMRRRACLQALRSLRRFQKRRSRRMCAICSCKRSLSPTPGTS